MVLGLALTLVLFPNVVVLNLHVKVEASSSALWLLGFGRLHVYKCGMRSG